MNRATLGPPVPSVAIDLPAFRIRSYSIVADLNGLGEAVLVFAGQIREQTDETTLLVSCHPRSGDVLRCTAHTAGRIEKIRPEWVPGIVQDIARTKTLELFNSADATP